MLSFKSERGFTLVELIIVIVLSGIVASMTASIITLPVNAYVDSSRRATLTDSAESALRRIQRDIQAALPNSIRVSNDGKSLELLHVVDGGRYRSKLASDGSGDSLDFSMSDTAFDVLGSLQNFSNITVGTDSIVVYPLASAGSNPYAGDNTAVISNGSTANHIVFAGFQFPLQSPQKRFFVIDGPVSYHCNTSASAPKNKTLMRYQSYSIQASQANPPGSGGAIQSNYISNCHFSYNSGSSLRSGLVTIALTLTDDVGESIRLTHQVHVSNQP
ncbi:MAG: type II secretion system protein [Gammaproteobacteria bacterium]|nr:type II secretion system protein [Gammaproteobacteria bacterium]